MTITHRLPRLHLACAAVAMLALHSCCLEPADWDRLKLVPG